MTEQNKLSQSITLNFVVAALVVAGVGYAMTTQLTNISVPVLTWESRPAVPKAAQIPAAEPDAIEMEATAPIEVPAAEPVMAEDTAMPAPVAAPESPAGEPALAGSPADQSVSEAAEQPLQAVPAAPEEAMPVAAAEPEDPTADLPALDEPAPGETAAPGVPTDTAPVAAAPAAAPAVAPAPAEAPAAPGVVATTAVESESAPAAAFESGASTAEHKALQELGLKDGEWLLGQNASQYSIQVVAVKTEPEMAGFLKKNPQLPKDDLAYFKRKSGGQEWLVLTSGVYPSLKEAVTAMNSLPEGAKARHPWVRKLDAVHKDIRID